MSIYKDWLGARAAKRRVSVAAFALDHLEWFSKNWSIFVGMSFAISVGYWFEFRRVYAIPVAFGSSSAFASLPALFGVVLLCNLMFAALLLSPSAALWLSVDNAGRRLIDGHRPATRSRVINPFRTSDLSRAWLVTQILSVAGALLAISFLDSSPRVRAILILGAIAAVFVSVDAMRVVRAAAGITGRGAWVANGYVIYATMLQCLAVTALGRLVFGAHSGGTGASPVGRWLWWFVACLVVGGAQFVLATAFRRRWTPVAARCLTFLLASLPAGPLVFPSLAADMAAFAYETPAKDGARCVRLLASHEADEADWAGLAPPGKPVQSFNLAYVAQIDGYQARRTRDADTITIPAVQVRGVTRCTPEVGPLPGEGD